MNITKEELNNRIELYAIISRLMLMEVDEEFLNIIESNEDILNLFPNYKDWSKREKFTKEELIEQHLNVDFTNLFLLHLVPYESFYTRDDQMIESGSDNPLIDLYNALDFKVETKEARVVSADHIGVELEFMYMLSKAMLKAFEADDEIGIIELLEVQKGFLQDHLLNWSPMYLINLKRESRTPIYHDGAELVLEFMLSDFEYINEKLK